MKRTLPALALLILSAGSLQAQEPATQPQQANPSATSGVKVSGIVKDSARNEVLEFASVTLVQQGKEATDGISTDSAGFFSFSRVAPGDYVLTVFYVGYPRLEKAIRVGGDGDVDLGLVNMQAIGNTLKEVQVVDIRQLIEQRPDGMVYNAEKDFTNKGTTADQMLRKVPMVTVDLEGNVQLRGSSNIRVFIDGKPSTIVAASVKDALKQIPSDNIKSVEVITSPGAKYDAEGTAGVINIITKKNLMKGVSGFLFSQLSYNVPQEFFTGNAGFNLNYRHNNFGLSLNAGASRWQMVLDMEARRTDFPNTARQTELIQKSAFDGGGNFYWSQLSADYQIDSLQSVQAGVNYNPGRWIQDVNQGSSFAAQPATGINRSTHTESPRDNIGFNAAWSKKFRNNPRRTLDILTQYAVNNNTTEYELSSNNTGSELVRYREHNINDSRNNEFTVQADYVHPLPKHNQKIETGLKFINRDISSDYRLQYWNNGDAGFSIDPLRTNRLDYNQQVGAAYAQFSTRLSQKVSMIAGARYEFTHIEGHQLEAGSDFDAQFSNLLPNLSFSYDLGGFSKLKLAYNKRIERPSINYVNPYVNYSDRYNLSYGNPLLVPENTHNAELTYSTFFSMTSLNFSGFYRYTGNAIENVTAVGADTVSRTTYQNVAKNHTMGLDFYGSTNLFSRWMINLNGSLYYKMLKSPSLNIENSGWQYVASMYTSFKLNDRFSLAGYAMYNGNQIQLQGSQTSWYYYFLGLQMTVLKGKGTLNLAGENFFSPEVKMTTKYQYQNADYTMRTTYFGRGLRLTFNLNFGKMNFVQKKQVDNNDLKEGQNGQQSMGGGGGR